MKRLFYVLLCAIVSFSSVWGQEKQKAKETAVFYLDGLDCQNCVKKVEKNIAFEKGVTGLKCNLDNGTATVTYKVDKTDVTKLTEAFDKIGMKTKSIEKVEDKKKGGK